MGDRDEFEGPKIFKNSNFLNFLTCTLPDLSSNSSEAITLAKFVFSPGSSPLFTVPVSISPWLTASAIVICFPVSEQVYRSCATSINPLPTASANVNLSTRRKWSPTSAGIAPSSMAFCNDTILSADNWTVLALFK